MAPRAIQCAGFTSIPRPIVRSILAGCKYSKVLTKAYLAESMQALADKHTHVSLKTYFDDTTAMAKGSQAAVHDRLMECMVDFRKFVHKLRLKISPKSTVVTSSEKLTKAICDELHSLGWQIKADRVTRDLGITFGAGNKKTGKQLRVRNKNTKISRQRIHKIANMSRMARKLFQGSAYSAATWGHQGSGCPEHLLLKLEVDAAKATGITPQGWCRFTSLCVAYGPRGHPRARVIKDTLANWFQLVRIKTGQQDIDEIGVAWARVKDDILLEYNKREHEETSKRITDAARKVVGIMSNVILLLISLGWDPVAFNIWRHPQKDLWISGASEKSKSDNVVINAVVDSSNLIQLQRASKHYNGKGIQNGIDWATTLGYLNKFRKRGEIDRANAMETIISGACWPQARVAEIHPEVSPMCQYCFSEPEDALHFFWTCPRHSACEAEEVAESQDLIELAIEDGQDNPSKWYRGIMSSSDISIGSDMEPTDQSIYVLKSNNLPINTEPDSWPSGFYFGDASGGPYTAYPSLRRVGVGVAMYRESERQADFRLHYPLPGQVQTVPRGETHVVLLVTSMLEQGAVATQYTDNYPVYKIFNKGEKFALASANRDIWLQIFQNIRRKRLRLELKWFPSHLSESPEERAKRKSKVKNPIPVPEWVTEWHIRGNELADSLAAEAAQACQLDSEVTKPVVLAVERIAKIQRRLVYLITNVSHRVVHRKPKTSKVKQLSVREATADSLHAIFYQAGRLFCAECRQSVSTINRKVAEQWAGTACIKITGAKLQEYDTVHIGRQATHHTHVLAYHRLVLYCTECGSYATHKHLIKLAKQCEPPTLHGKHCLEAFRLDKCPPGLGSWPAGGGAICKIGPAKTGHTKMHAKSMVPRQVASSSQSVARIDAPAKVDVDSSIDPKVHSPKPSPPPLQFNLRELLELEECGERVKWPSGYDAVVASAYIADYELAKNIGMLYTRETETVIEESTPTRMIHAPIIMEAESSEPGPLPQVSGSHRDNTIRIISTPNTRPKRRCISLKEYNDRK